MLDSTQVSPCNMVLLQDHQNVLEEDPLSYFRVHLTNLKCWLSTQLYFQQAGRLLSGRPDPSERKTLGGIYFILDSKSNNYTIIYSFFIYISVGAGEQHQKY